MFIKINLNTFFRINNVCNLFKNNVNFQKNNFKLFDQRLCVKFLSNPVQNLPTTPHAQSSKKDIDRDDEEYKEDITLKHDLNHINIDVINIRRPAKSLIITNLRKLLKCSNEQALTIYYKEEKIRYVPIKQLATLVELLQSENVQISSIVENSNILKLTPDNLKEKLKILQCNNDRKLDDLLPLLSLTNVVLTKVCRLSDSNGSSKLHRIYYMSNKLNVSPQLVAKYFSTHTFIFYVPLNSLKTNLDILLKFDVAPVNILRDLWVFKYSYESIITRLQRAKHAKKDKIMPWMVRCSEAILENTLKTTQEEKALLGENDSTLQYIANRLNYDVMTTKSILNKHPLVAKVRIIKVKEILDYLLDEAGFLPHHIAMVPRIFCHSLETTKERVNHLKSLNCEITTLVILCRSRREYEKFINNWKTVRESKMNSTINEDNNSSTILINNR